MDLFERNPENCAHVGLECGTCVRGTAESVMHVCRGSRRDQLFAIFSGLYPSAGCAGMASAFVEACLRSEGRGRRTAAA